MSDWILGGDIDRWITGNYGEDQEREEEEPEEEE